MKRQQNLWRTKENLKVKNLNQDEIANEQILSSSVFIVSMLIFTSFSGIVDSCENVQISNETKILRAQAHQLLVE